MTHQSFIQRSSILWNKFWNEPTFDFFLLAIFKIYTQKNTLPPNISEFKNFTFCKNKFWKEPTCDFFVRILKWYVPNYFSKAVNSISKLHYEIRFFHKHKIPSLQNRKLLLIENMTKTNSKFLLVKLRFL